MKRFFLLLLISLFAFSAPNAQQYGVQDLMKVKRVGDPQLSPDARTIAFTITDTDQKTLKRTTQIYLLPAAGGGEAAASLCAGAACGADSFAVRFASGGTNASGSSERRTLPVA